MAFEFLGGVLGAQSLQAAAPQFEIINIPLTDIEPNEKNTVRIDQIEELADSIRMVGLKQNLEVMKNPPGSAVPYRLISGERRYTALCLLAKEDDRFSHAPCVVSDPSQVELDISPESKELVSIMETNATARQLSDTEIMEYIANYQAVFEEMKANGTAQGRARDFIAKRLRMSPSAIHRYQTVDKNLSEDFKRDLQEGKIAMAAAAEIAKEDQETQAAIREKIKAGASVTQKDVSEAKQQVEADKKEAVFFTATLRDVDELSVELETIISLFRDQKTVRLAGDDWLKMGKLKVAAVKNLRQLRNLLVAAEAGKDAQ